VCCPFNPFVSPYWLLGRWFKELSQDNGAFLKGKHPGSKKESAAESHNFA
jgi:hypothetical protein